MIWQDFPIKDLCELAVDCVNKTAPVVDYETPYRMLRTTNVRGGFVDAENTRFVAEETFIKWTRRGTPKKGDVILTREAPLGDVGRLTSDNRVFLGQRLFMYRADPEKLDSEYLAYVLQSPLVQGRFRSKGFGATVEHAKVGDCENLLIPVPDLVTQKKIGSILSTYDNLIENNKRRIELLEKTARQLYKEWFVRLRFPGYEHVKIIDGMPEGWKSCVASQALYINPKVSVEKGMEITHVPMACLSESQMTVDVSKFEKRSIHTPVKFISGDTLFARITPCLENGKTAFVNFLHDKEVACGSTEFLVLRGRKVSNYFAYLLAREESFRGNAIKSMIGSIVDPENWTMC